MLRVMAKVRLSVRITACAALIVGHAACCCSEAIVSLGASLLSRAVPSGMVAEALAGAEACLPKNPIACECRERERKRAYGFRPGLRGELRRVRRPTLALRRVGEPKWESHRKWEMDLFFTSNQLCQAMAPTQSEQDAREAAALPARGTIKLPLIAPFDSPESIVQALSTRDTPLLTAGWFCSSHLSRDILISSCLPALIQVEKRALSLVAKAAPRATPDPLLDYLTKFPTADGIFAAWDTAHKVSQRSCCNGGSNREGRGRQRKTLDNKRGEAGSLRWSEADSQGAK
jgi:hypothetical protein